jgi:hypothetical protein
VKPCPKGLTHGPCDLMSRRGICSINQKKCVFPATWAYVITMNPCHRCGLEASLSQDADLCLRCQGFLIGTAGV